MLATIDDLIQFPNPVFDPSLGFYPRATAARLARVPLHILRRWDKDGIVPATVCWTTGQDADVLGYNFESLIYLRLIRMLREMERPFPLRKIVETVKYLMTQCGPPGPKWVEARIMSDRHNLWVQYPVLAAANRGGQTLMHRAFLFDQQFALFAERADALLIPREFLRWVEIRPAVRNGMPVVKGTGIETAVIHSAFGQGLTASDIRGRYPFLTLPQINHSEGFEAFLNHEEYQAV